MAEPARPLPRRTVVAAAGIDGLRGLVAATRPRRGGGAGASAPPWTRANLAGRIVELSGEGASASLTFAVALVLDAQRRGETAAWVTSRESSFFPPDVAENGVDLAALPVVRVPEPRHVARSGERLVRSGAFDLVVLDLGRAGEAPLALLTRMLGLAERHDTAVVFLTEKTAARPSLGSVVSLRAESRRERTGDGEFACALTALRDRKNPAGWTHRETRRGPDGVR
jgi:recombination protein RecA